MCVVMCVWSRAVHKHHPNLTEANNSFALPINLDSRKYLAHLDLRYIQVTLTLSQEAFPDLERHTL